MYSDQDLLALAQSLDDDPLTRRGRKVEDFVFDQSTEKYWEVATGLELSALALDGAIGLNGWPTHENDEGELVRTKPSAFLWNYDNGYTVESATWWPGKPRLIGGAVATPEGMKRVKGAVSYNLYQPPPQLPKPENVTAELWVEHVRRLYPEPVEHNFFFDFCAHAIQKPGEKANMGVVMSGSQGIGKDAALLPLKYAVGEGNYVDVNADVIGGQWTHYAKSVLLVINEMKTHSTHHKASDFYNTIKTLLVTPPENIAVNAKYKPVVYVKNVCHVVMTTNEPFSLYIPPEDRRLFIMHSLLNRDELGEAYFGRLFSFLRSDEGLAAITHWLAERDISQFKASSPPPMSVTKGAITVTAEEVRRKPVDDVVEGFIHAADSPPVFFPPDLVEYVNSCDAFDEEAEMLKALRSSALPHVINRVGYRTVRNPDSRYWRAGKFQSRVAYVAAQFEESTQIEMVEARLEEIKQQQARESKGLHVVEGSKPPEKG